MSTAHRLTWRLFVACCAGLLTLAAAPARAVIIQTASGTGNTTAPADDPGWNNVSIRGNGTSEAQAVAGDSGGPVFAKHGGQWQLAGIMVAAEGYSGQPSLELTAVFGNETFMADLSYYRNQIVAVVPEPGAVALAGMALAAGAAWAAGLSRRDKATGRAARHGVTGLRWMCRLPVCGYRLGPIRHGFRRW